MVIQIDFETKFQELHLHPKAVKGNKNEVGAPMPGTVIGNLIEKQLYKFGDRNVTHLTHFIFPFRCSCEGRRSR